MVLARAWVLVAIFVPLIAPYDPLTQSSHLLLAPSLTHLFGTDELGRDVFSRVLWGSRLSLPLAFLLVSAAVLIGGTLGGIAGYFGGLGDEVVMRATDLVFAFPTIILAMAVTAALGPSLRNAVLAVLIVFFLFRLAIRSRAGPAPGRGVVLRSLATFAGAVLLGVGVSAIMLVPFAELPRLGRTPIGDARQLAIAEAHVLHSLRAFSTRPRIAAAAALAAERCRIRIRGQGRNYSALRTRT